MSVARHAELRDLLGAYALGAVDASEAAALREHLATCDTCQAEMTELWSAVDALPALVEPMEPPPALRGRIAAAIAQEGVTGGPQPAAPTPPRAAVPSRAEAPVLPARWWSNASPWAAAAAILLLLSAGLLIWNLRLREEIATTAVPETIALAPTELAPGASGEVTYLPQSQILFLDVRDLPPLAPDQVYEVWLIGGDGEPAPAGVFDQPTDQHAIVADRNQFETLAITAEPGPLGTEAPTGEIVATAPL
jgi:anti-sigma-K factor RskA